MKLADLISPGALGLPSLALFLSLTLPAQAEFDTPFFASATARVVNGFVVEVVVTHGGRAYTYAPAITFVGGGQGAEAVAVVKDGAVQEIRVTNAGFGYTSAPEVVIAPPPFPFVDYIQMVPLLSTRALIGSEVQIQYSENLGAPNSWKVLTNLVVNLSPYTFVDLSAPPSPRRFYRLINLSLLSPANDLSLLVWILPGSFSMGSPPTEKDRGSNEGPVTSVTITRGFWLSKYETTQAQFEEVTGRNPSHYLGDFNLPIENITWSDATNYCAKLTDMMRTAGKLPAGYVYRLPTEAEWEYACRAGTSTRFSYGDDLTYSELGDYAWYSANAGLKTHPVGQKKPNPWGIYDMHGNVQEFCLDYYTLSHPGGNVTDPKGAISGTRYVRRGGLITVEAQSCRSAVRMEGGDQRVFLGFRVALAPPL